MENDNIQNNFILKGSNQNGASIHVPRHTWRPLLITPQGYLSTTKLRIWRFLEKLECAYITLNWLSKRYIRLRRPLLWVQNALPLEERWRNAYGFYRIESRHIPEWITPAGGSKYVSIDPCSGKGRSKNQWKKEKKKKSSRDWRVFSVGCQSNRALNDYHAPSTKRTLQPPFFYCPVHRWSRCVEGGRWIKWRFLAAPVVGQGPRER